MEGYARIIVLSNDTDVVILLLYYFEKFSDAGLHELWIRYGTQDKTRFIPIHILAKNSEKVNAKVYWELNFGKVN